MEPLADKKLAAATAAGGLNTVPWCLPGRTVVKWVWWTRKPRVPALVLRQGEFAMKAFLAPAPSFWYRFALNFSQA
jgi:hypothetical protein